MMNRLKRKQGGFTLIELLIVVAIIGIIAALLIPNFLDALQKAKQKRTVADMRNVGTAMMSWLTDQVGAAAAGQDFDWSSYTGGGYSTVESELEPQYIQQVPDKDGWKNDFEYKMATGADVLGERVLAVRSPGRGGDYEGTSYSTGPFDPTDYARDIVWGDGYFVRWPQKVTTN